MPKPLRQADYATRIESYLPQGAQDLAVSEQGAGLRLSPPSRVELRRWGPSFEPLDYQQEVIGGLTSELDRQGRVLGLLMLPTGSGKTLSTSWTVLDVLRRLASTRADPVRVVWMAPQRELLRQAADALQAAWWSGRGPESLDLEIVESSRSFGSPDHHTCHLLTPQLLSRIGMQRFGSADIAVFDEAHHAAAEVYSEVWREVADAGECCFALGLSATPTRTLARQIPDLRRAFANTLYTPASLGLDPLQALIEKGVLSSPQIKEIPDVPPYAQSKGLDDKRTARGLVADPDRWRATVECVLNCEGPTTVFALDRYHGTRLTQHLRAIGEQAEYLDGRTSMANRIGILERFRNGVTRVLVNVALLIEGIDCPAAQNAVLTYPVGSPIVLTQMVGRVLRGPQVGGTAKSYIWSADGADGAIARMIAQEEYSLVEWDVVRLTVDKVR